MPWSCVQGFTFPPTHPTHPVVPRQQVALTLTDPKQNGRGDVDRNVTSRGWSGTPRAPRLPGTGGGQDQPLEPLLAVMAGGGEGPAKPIAFSDFPSLSWRVEMTIPNITKLILQANFS